MTVSYLTKQDNSKIYNHFLFSMTPDEAMKMFTARQPTGRFCSKEEVAKLALYLASDASTYTTGGEHVIDGGWSL